MDGMLVHRRVTPSIKFPGTHLYTWVERGTVRVKCLAQEHNTMSPARARTRTARSRDERTNHEATAPPINGKRCFYFFIEFYVIHRKKIRGKKFDHKTTLKLHILPRSFASRTNICFTNIKFPRGQLSADGSSTETLCC